jgi:hypothetical protein
VDPVTFLVKLPLSPLTGLLRLAEFLRVQAEREMHDPANVRRQLEEAEQARAAGELSPRDEARVEDAALARLSGGPRRPADRNDGNDRRR